MATHHCEEHRKYQAGCGACQALKTAYVRQARTGRPARVYGPNEINHGLTGYQYWRCRCPVCMEARRVSKRKEGPAGKPAEVTFESWPTRRGVVMAADILARVPASMR